MEIARPILLTALLTGTLASAQPEKVALSLQDALRLAEERSESIVAARAGVLRAGAEQMRARADFMPQIGASVAYDRPIASEFEGVGETPEFPPGTDPVDIKIAQALGAVFGNLPFGKPSWRANASASQNIFAGGRLLARSRLANAGFESARVSLASARAQALLDVSQAYFDALLTDRLVEIAEATLAQAQATRDQARLSRNVGGRAEFDVLRAEVAYENQVPVILEQKLARELARLRLKQLLEIPPEREVILTTELADEGLKIVVGGEVMEGTPRPAEVERAPVRLAEKAVRMSEESVRMAWSGHWPSLAITASGGWVGYTEQDRFFPPSDGWFPSVNVGLQLRIPIFNGFRVVGDVRSAEADLMEARARLKLTEELAQLDTLSAHQQLQSAQAKFEASGGAVQQSQRAYEIAEIRYREGVSTQLELDDARLQLQQARASRALAARDLEVARIRIALLPDLPLSVGGGAAPSAGAARGGAPAQASGAGAAGAMDSSAGAAGAGGAGGFGGGGM